MKVKKINYLFYLAKKWMEIENYSNYFYFCLNEVPRYRNVIFY